MLNIVHFAYVPNTASTNRLLSYLNNIPENIKVRVYFLMPDNEKSKIEYLPHNVEVIYCWERFRVILKILRPLIYRRALKFIRQNLQKGDIVYSYNIPHFINNIYKDGVRYYGERTESPEVTTSTSRLVPFTLKDHLILCKKLDGIFVISTFLRDYYISHGIDENKIHIINMTVDPDRFDNINKQDISIKYIAYCGNVSNTKDGVDKLLKSFAIVNKEYPDLYLYIIGNSPTSESDSNIALINKMGLANRVIFTGLVAADVMPQLLKNAEVCVLARPDSIQAQCGFPTKLGEYLLTGNPVVITDVGDIPLFLKDGESALISSSNDDNEFAHKILVLLNDPAKAQYIGAKGREIALKHFNAKTEVLKLLIYMNAK